METSFTQKSLNLRPSPNAYAAAVASVEVVTRNIGDGEVEHVHKSKVWDINSALETLAKHLDCSSSVSSTLGA
ncbi:hypothetical protein [Sinorhizobium meliloti]|uniref:hypothetical protein n=1 Tax=Rhizobium meliloti TaxID=382 RepID=UPI001F43C6F7|nr:hypothetical protein [Sinorhizobium meliloti]